MGKRHTPGLQKRWGLWHIDKVVGRRRICESTGTDQIEEAERYLAERVEQIRQAKLFGQRPERTFCEAAARYLREKQHKARVEDDAYHLKQLMPFIGNLNLDEVHIGSLQPFIRARQKEGRKTKTINLALAVVRHLMNLASTEWIDENNLTWIHVAPKIRLLPIHDARDPYPLSWDEQIRLFNELPVHLRDMALFKVNTGCRDLEVCRLQWQWEIQVPEINSSIFLIPKQMVKNREERLVVLNDIAKSVIERRRGLDPTFVFTYQGSPLTGMNNTAWRSARQRAGLPQVRVHDLKHTFGRRLRAAGVSFEDRQDLLGHKSGRITSHYSCAELQNLFAAANKACDRSRQGAGLTLLKRTLQVT